MNDGGDAASFLYLLGCLVLVGSALMVHRLPLGQGLKMAVAWALIFAAVFAVFTLRDDFRALGRRMIAGASDAPVVEGGTVRIRQGADGHYWVDASLNGESVRFLVDSGATTTGIDSATADRAGVAPGRGFPVAVSTANGTIFVRRAVASKLAVGPIERDEFPIWVGQDEEGMNVLGMNFLSSLSGWGTEDGWLVLRP